MTDYELGRQGRRKGQSYNASPYWSWFRRCTWQRGWVDEDQAIRAVDACKGRRRDDHKNIAEAA
jgi:hypothetical protein